MNDEIKHKIDRLFVYRNENDEMKYQPEDILTIEDVWLLLDHITNLREENERLNAQIDAMITLSKKDYKEIYEYLGRFRDGNVHFELPNTLGLLEDYKSRNEKAVKFLKDNALYEEETKQCIEDLIYYRCDELLNILQGDDKDVKD